MWGRTKAFYGSHRDALYTLLVIILVAFFAFGLGRLSVFYGEKGELKVEYPENRSAGEVQGLGFIQTSALISAHRTHTLKPFRSHVLY